MGKVTMYASFFENLHCKLNKNLEFRSFEMNFRSCLSIKWASMVTERNMFIFETDF